MATMETNERFGYISSLLFVRMETIKALGNYFSQCFGKLLVMKFKVSIAT